MFRILLRSLALGATLLIATLSPAANKFDHAEYMKATATGQKRAEPPIKGTLSFEKEKKCVDFLDEKGNPAFSIRYDAVKTLLGIGVGVTVVVVGTVVAIESPPQTSELVRFRVHSLVLKRCLDRHIRTSLISLDKTLRFGEEIL
jgi:hypothetical protein